MSMRRSSKLPDLDHCLLIFLKFYLLLFGWCISVIDLLSVFFPLYFIVYSIILEHVQSEFQFLKLRPVTSVKV